MADPATRDTLSVPARTTLAVDNLRDIDFRMMVEEVSDYAIFLLDPSGLVLSWNSGARKMKGYEAAEVIGKPISVFYPSELLAKNWPEHELRMAREHGRIEDEGWRVRKDGTRFWANIVITRLSGPGGELRGYSKITRDVTERRRQDELLRLSEERFRLLVEGVHDYAIFMLDPSGHIVSWNSGARKNKGYEAGEIIGKHFSVFYPPEVAARGWPAEELQLALREGSLEDEGWRVRKDGSRFWASVVITALCDASGNHRGFAKVTRDLTERRKVTALEDEGRRITTFLAMLGHELRNPIAPISNAVAIMERDKTDSPTLRIARDTIGRQLKQLTRLVDDLLDVGRITSGKIHIESKPVSLADALDEALESVRPLSQSKSQHIDVRVDYDLWISGDRARIVQIFCNLLNNAVKFSPDGGAIQARLCRSGSQAELHVVDNGPGIPSEDLQRIFDLFVQGEQDLARSKGGLGLGLSLVQQLTMLHGGTVSAFSKGEPGEGAEFVVQLPATAAPSNAQRSDTDRNGRRVLIVDDNRDAAETMSLLLDVLGYQPSTAFDGIAAVAAIKADAPDVVLLDIGLPGMSGIEVAKTVLAEVANPPKLIAVTGYGQERDREISFDAGFYAHLTKPVDVDQLSVLLERLLGAPEAARDA